MGQAEPVLNPHSVLNAYRDAGGADGDKCHSLLAFVAQVLVEFSEQLHVIAK